MGASVVRAMILAAGFGKRMMPLTARIPKPLLPVNGKPLIQYHIERLSSVGIREMVINISHLGEQIENYCGDGSRFGVALRYSHEAEPLETAGGIVKAMPLLVDNQADDRFIIVNGDIWTDYDFSRLLHKKATPSLAHLVLVDNPDHHPSGDFALQSDGWLAMVGEKPLTYSGIALLSKELFGRYQVAGGPLAPVLRQAIMNHQVTGEHYPGAWYDVGTPARLEEVSRLVASRLI